MEILWRGAQCTAMGLSSLAAMRLAATTRRRAPKERQAPVAAPGLAVPGVAGFDVRFRVVAADPMAGEVLRRGTELHYLHGQMFIEPR